MRYVYLLAAIAGLLMASYIKGRYDGHDLERVKWERRDNTALREANRALDSMHRHVRTKEKEYAEVLSNLAWLYHQESNRVKADADATIARIRAGAVKLRDPRATPCPAPRVQLPGAPAGAAGGESAPQAGELSPETAAALAELAREADALVGELNYCWAIVRKDRGIE